MKPKPTLEERKRGRVRAHLVRWQRFCEAYHNEPNGTKAAIAAGYKPRSAHVWASLLLDKPEIKAMLAKLAEKRAKKLDITAERVLEELARLGFASMADFLRVDGSGQAHVDLSKADREKMASIQELSVEDTRHGTRSRIRIADKVRGLELLGRNLSLFQDRMKIELSGLESLAEAIEKGRKRLRQAKDDK